MAFVGRKPTNAPLTSSDLGTGIVGSTNIADGTIVNADINSSAAIAYSKLSLANSVALTDLSATGTKDSTTFLRGDNTFATAGASAGQVIQVVSATDSTQRTTSSTSFVSGSTTLSVAITPSSTANKILVLAGASVYGTDADSHFTVFRGATDLGAASNKGFLLVNSTSGARGSLGINYLDSPNTTSSTTYEVRFRSAVSGTTYLNEGSTKGSITLLEIKG